MYAKCHEKRYSEIIEPKLEDTQYGFRPSSNTVAQIFTLQQIFGKSWKYAQMTTRVLSTSRKHTTGSIEKYVGELCWSTVLTSACYGRSRHCIPAERFASVSAELNHKRSLWVFTTTLKILYESDRQSQPSRRGCHCWVLQDQAFIFLQTI